MNFFLSTDIIIEIGAANLIVDLIRGHSGGKVGIIYDAVIEDEPYFNKILDGLCSSAKCILYPNNFPGEPTYGHLEEVAKHFRQEKLSVIIVFGGGSTMDLAKGVALLVTNEGPALSYRGFPENVNAPIPVITVPTLLGSGAEVSYNAVFIDENEERKLGINYKGNFPRKTVIDPLLSMSAPMKNVVYSALDSLVHCVDSFGSRKRTPLSKIFSVEGFRHSLAALNGDLSDPEVRLGIGVGSVCGTAALMNSGDGPTNGFAYYLGVQKRIPHGLAGAIFLLEVMRWNYSHGFIDYAELIPNDSNLDARGQVEDLLTRLESIYKKHEIQNLGSFGYGRDDIHQLATDASKSLKGSFGGNPIEFNEKAAAEVISKLI